MYFQLFSDDLYLDRTNLRLFKEILFDINAIKVDLIGFSQKIKYKKAMHVENKLQI